jgi:hypothetical protein
MAIGLAVWKRHRLAGVRHEPNLAAAPGVRHEPNLGVRHEPNLAAAPGRQCTEVLTKPLELAQLGADGPFYFTVNVGFGHAEGHGSAQDGASHATGGAAPAHGASALFAEVRMASA